MRVLLLLLLSAALCCSFCCQGVAARQDEGRHHRRQNQLLHHHHHHHHHHHRTTNLSAMTPEAQNNTEVVVQVGGTASIKCYTHLLGDEMVTWMKRDEEQLLTVGGQVYSSETRYSIAHVRHQKLWELSLRDVKLSDAGSYECQLTTHPPSSLFFTLRVVEARAVIEGPAEVHVHTGVRLKLYCYVEGATQAPTHIFWYHNSSMINYMTRRGVVVRHHHGLLHASTLVVHNVTWGDAGIYRCEPHLATPANLTLHVIAEEKHAALHKHSEEDDAAQAPQPPPPAASAAPLLAPPILLLPLLLLPLTLLLPLLLTLPVLLLPLLLAPPTLLPHLVRGR